MGTACCREKGVPDICFGYCLKERKAESRAITGICHRWFELIGKCLGSNYNTSQQLHNRIIKFLFGC